MQEDTDIVIVNYGVGNIASIKNMLRRIGVGVRISGEASEISEARRLILPGVGAFDAAMERLCAINGDAAVIAAATNGATVLGVCVGAQLLLERSDEGQRNGLGLIRGSVRKFDASRIGLPVPHMGWNVINARHGKRLFQPSEEEERYYFAHSYYMECCNADDVAATATYGETFACAFERGSIFGVQFHPEKSHRFGMQFFERFDRLSC